MAEYALTELMAVTAAREIEEGEIVFAGTGLPMLGAMLAQRTHASHCCIIFEAGTVASQLAHLPMSVGDPRVMRGAATAAGLSEVFNYVLQAGRVDVGFLSGARIDQFGNINSTSIGAIHSILKCAFRAVVGHAISLALPGGRLSSHCMKSDASPKR
jgi:glutaconate CoA-transferase subunit B